MIKLHYGIYFFSLITIHLIYGLVFLGVFSTVPKYVYTWNMLVQMLLCLFLMVRYHPFRNEYKFKPIDAKLIFGASLLLFVNIISLPLLYSHVYSRLAEPIRKVLPQELPDLPSTNITK